MDARKAKNNAFLKRGQEKAAQARTNYRPLSKKSSPVSVPKTVQKHSITITPSGGAVTGGTVNRKPYVLPDAARNTLKGPYKYEDDMMYRLRGNAPRPYDMKASRKSSRNEVLETTRMGVNVDPLQRITRKRIFIKEL